MANTTTDNNSKELINVCKLKTSEMFVKLHQFALNKSDTENGDYIIKNSAFEGDGKNIKFIGSGQHIIGILPKEVKSKDSIPIIKKEEAFEKIKNYIHWLIGPDIANKLTIDKLVPIEVQSEKPKKINQEENNQKDTNQEENNQEETNKKEQKDKVDNKENNNETIIQSSLNNVLNQTFKDYLIEKNIIQLNEVAENNDTSKSNDDSAYGYQVAYQILIDGKSEITLAKSAARFSKKFLSGVLKSLGKTVGGILGDFGFTFYDGNSRKDSKTLGQYANKISKTVKATFDTIKEILSKKIEPDKLLSETRTVLNKKFPSNDCQTEIYSSQTISKFLKQRLTSKDKQLLNNAKYSICIKTYKKDKSYELYNRSSIADVVTNAIYNLLPKSMRKLKLNAKDIIFINNYSDNKQEKLKYTADSLNKSIDMMNLIFEGISGLDIIQEELLNEVQKQANQNDKLVKLIQTLTLDTIRKNEEQIQQNLIKHSKNGLEKYKEYYEKINELLFKTSDDNIDEIKKEIRSMPKKESDAHKKNHFLSLLKSALEKIKSEDNKEQEDNKEPEDKKEPEDNDDSNEKSNTKLPVHKTNTDIYIIPLPGLNYKDSNNTSKK